MYRLDRQTGISYHLRCLRQEYFHSRVRKKSKAVLVPAAIAILLLSPSAEIINPVQPTSSVLNGNCPSTLLALRNITGSAHDLNTQISIFLSNNENANEKINERISRLQFKYLRHTETNKNKTDGENDISDEVQEMSIGDSIEITEEDIINSSITPPSISEESIISDIETESNKSITSSIEDDVVINEISENESIMESPSFRSIDSDSDLVKSLRAMLTPTGSDIMEDIDDMNFQSLIDAGSEIFDEVSLLSSSRNEKNDPPPLYRSIQSLKSLLQSSVPLDDDIVDDFTSPLVRQSIQSLRDLLSGSTNIHDETTDIMQSVNRLSSLLVGGENFNDDIITSDSIQTVQSLTSSNPHIARPTKRSRNRRQFLSSVETFDETFASYQPESVITSIEEFDYDIVEDIPETDVQDSVDDSIPNLFSKVGSFSMSSRSRLEISTATNDYKSTVGFLPEINHTSEEIDEEINLGIEDLIISDVFVEDIPEEEANYKHSDSDVDIIDDVIGSQISEDGFSSKSIPESMVTDPVQSSMESQESIASSISDNVTNQLSGVQSVDDSNTSISNSGSDGTSHSPWSSYDTSCDTTVSSSSWSSYPRKKIKKISKKINQITGNILLTTDTPNSSDADDEGTLEET